jgi:hypothetical protein
MFLSASEGSYLRRPPNLPADYLAAIDGLRPSSRVGTCADTANGPDNDLPSPDALSFLIQIEVKPVA